MDDLIESARWAFGMSGHPDAVEASEEVRIRLGAAAARRTYEAHQVEVNAAIDAVPHLRAILATPPGSRPVCSWEEALPILRAAYGRPESSAARVMGRAYHWWPERFDAAFPPPDEPDD